MRSGDRPGLQNRRVAGNPVTGGFDPHSLPPLFNDLARGRNPLAPSAIIRSAFFMCAIRDPKRMLLSEAEGEAWDTCERRGQAAFSILAHRLVLLPISLRRLVSAPETQFNS